jgi:hypothetical protein
MAPTRKKLKGITRRKKEFIIATLNPSWRDTAIDVPAALEVATE